MNGKQIYRVLFLCTANSARSILAEAALNRAGAGRFEAFSAGSAPRGEVNPAALELLRKEGFDVARFRSKGWEEFATPGAPELDLIITLCDSAAGETCPVWPGRPISAHWGLPDPAAVAGEAERRAAFAATLRALEARIAQLVDLPIAELDAAGLRRQLVAIGMQPAGQPIGLGS
jgi:arsenate reductase (thioredoxin)